MAGMRLMDHSTSLTKKCVACCLPISAKARKCQHCREIQKNAKSWKNRTIIDFMSAAFLLLVSVFVGYVLCGVLYKTDFTPKLIVGTSSLCTQPGQDAKRVCCLASIQNKDIFTWETLSFQAEFFDAQGHLIDVHYDRPHKKSAFANQTVQGRVVTRPNAEISQYASCKLKVLSAR